MGVWRNAFACGPASGGPIVCVVAAGSIVVGALITLLLRYLAVAVGG